MIKAEDRDGRVVVAPALAEEEWRDYRQWHAAEQKHGRAVFRCPDCRGRLYPAELTHYGTWYFSHYGSDTKKACLLRELDGESSEHRRLKMVFYQAINSTGGWQADVEVASGDHDEESVLDVLATRQVPKPERDDRYGFEVQLSPQNEGVVLNRQEIRERWTARTTWITTKKYSWSEHLPWFKIGAADTPLADQVIDGVMVQTGDLDYPWVVAEPFPAQDMTRRILRGTVNYASNFGWRLFADGPVTVRPRRERRGEFVREGCDRPVAKHIIELDDHFIANPQAWPEDSWRWQRRRAGEL